MTFSLPRLAKYLTLAFAGVTLTAQIAKAQSAVPDNRPVVRVAVQQIPIAARSIPYANRVTSGHAYCR